MPNRVSNFSDLIQRVTASCLLHPLADVRHDAVEVAGRNGEPFDSEELVEEEEFEELNEREQKEVKNSREIVVGTERLTEMRTLITEVFDSVSAMKKAYANLQEAHCPWDPEKMKVADMAVVTELRWLGVMKERFRRSMIIDGGTGERIRRRRNGEADGMVREVVAPYEAAVEELKVKVKEREMEVENLKEKLNSITVDSVTSKNGSSRSKKKVSRSLLQVAACPTPELFEVTMTQFKEASKSFTTLLLSLMRSARWDISTAVNSISASSDNTARLISPTTSITSIHHAKFALESYISHKIFQHFDHETFYMDGSLSSLLNPDQFRRDCFTQYRDMRAMDPIELLGILPTCQFGKFCSKKYLEIVPSKMEESLFGNIEQRREVLAGNHPRTKFYGGFLGLAKAVWLLHLLAFSLDPTASLFEASRGAEFHEQYMESTVKFSGGKVPAGQIVGFSVCPGFKLGNGSLIKARVFLVSRS